MTQYIHFWEGREKARKQIDEIIQKVITKVIEEMKMKTEAQKTVNSIWGGTHPKAKIEETGFVWYDDVVVVADNKALEISAWCVIHLMQSGLSKLCLQQRSTNQENLYLWIDCADDNIVDTTYIYRIKTPALIASEPTEEVPIKPTDQDKIITELQNKLDEHKKQEAWYLSHIKTLEDRTREIYQTHNNKIGVLQAIIDTKEKHLQGYRNNEKRVKNTNHELRQQVKGLHSLVVSLGEPQ